MTFVLILILCAILWPVATRHGIRVGCSLVLVFLLVVVVFGFLDATAVRS